MQVFIFERTLSGHLRRVDCYPQRFCFLKATQGCQDRARDNIVALFRFDFCSVTMDAEPGGGIEVELGLVVSQCRVQQFRCYIPEPFSPPGLVQSHKTVSSMSDGSPRSQGFCWCVCCQSSTWSNAVSKLQNTTKNHYKKRPLTFVTLCENDDISDNWEREF